MEAKENEKKLGSCDRLRSIGCSWKREDDVFTVGPLIACKLESPQWTYLQELLTSRNKYKCKRYFAGGDIMNKSCRGAAKLHMELCGTIGIKSFFVRRYTAAKLGSAFRTTGKIAFPSPAIKKQHEAFIFRNEDASPRVGRDSSRLFGSQQPRRNRPCPHPKRPKRDLGVRPCVGKFAATPDLECPTQHGDLFPYQFTREHITFTTGSMFSIACPRLLNDA